LSFVKRIPHRLLLAKGENLSMERDSRPEKRAKSGKKGREGAGPRRCSLTVYAENITHFDTDGIYRRDN